MDLITVILSVFNITYLFFSFFYNLQKENRILFILHVFLSHIHPVNFMIVNALFINKIWSAVHLA